jgi:hypothetical protein
MNLRAAGRNYYQKRKPKKPARATFAREGTIARWWEGLLTYHFQPADVD